MISSQVSKNWQIHPWTCLTYSIAIIRINQRIQIGAKISSGYSSQLKRRYAWMKITKWTSQHIICSPDERHASNMWATMALGINVRTCKPLIAVCLVIWMIWVPILPTAVSSLNSCTLSSIPCQLMTLIVKRQGSVLASACSVWLTSYVTTASDQATRQVYQSIFSRYIVKALKEV